MLEDYVFAALQCFVELYPGLGLCLPLIGIYTCQPNMNKNTAVINNPPGNAENAPQNAQRKTTGLVELSPVQSCSTSLFDQEDLVRNYCQDLIGGAGGQLPGWWQNYPPLNINPAQPVPLPGLTNFSLERGANGLIKLSPLNPWTLEEDDLLEMAVQRFKMENLVRVGGGGRELNSVLQLFEGKNWEKIAECFKGRSPSDCALRWYQLVTVSIAKREWSKEEDERMIRVVREYGENSWFTIAAYFPGRTQKQCEKRWHNHIIHNMDIEAWTKEEECALIRALNIYGNDKWAELTKFFPGRTEDAIKKHWFSCVAEKLGEYVSLGVVKELRGLSQLTTLPTDQSAASPPTEAEQVVNELRDQMNLQNASSEVTERCESSKSRENVLIEQPMGDSKATDESSS